MANAFDTLLDRGFVYQLTDEAQIRERLGRESLTFYIGFDPTADSLHIGHLLPVMAARWLQQAGHRPVILVGGGTAMIGDPSGKTEARQLLSRDEVRDNAAAIRNQLSRFLNFDSDDRGLLVNNVDWLADLNYLEFLRDVGRHFSVNRMLTAESVRLRLETGLSFLEFNYMLLQAYDFHVLARDCDCRMQLGGQDQWGNIVAGIDLVRRTLGTTVYGVTLPLLTDAQGRKFGKTEEGAVWLDPDRTSVFDYYQFWRNVDDRDVGRLLALFTSLPLDEFKRLGDLGEPEINRAKEILAFEATALAHGEEKAREAYLAAGATFGFADPEGKVETSSALRHIRPATAGATAPTVNVEAHLFEGGLWIAKLFVLAGLAKSNGAARRLVNNGGAYLNDERVTDVDYEVSETDFRDDELMLRSGKKQVRRIVRTR